MKLAITDARAAELAALDEAAERRRPVGGWITDEFGVALTRLAASTSDLLADRRTLLDALRRADSQLDSILCLLVEGPDAAPRGWRDSAQKVAMKALADLRALLASAERDVRDLDAIR